MAGAAEKAAEEIEWVVAATAAAATTAAALFVLRETIVAVLVVDFTRFGAGEGFIGFRDLNEFFRGGIVAAR